jgi:hypothetical protein
MSTLTTIGQTELIRLPELLDQPVHARIDTGAKTSAIWASQVNRHPDGLEVVFFAKGADDYTGQVVHFTEFAETVVASSNGISQRRYKVRLLVKIQGRPIRAWFTLADRSSQVYPVLIGRNILRGKFIVDVARQTNNLRRDEQKRTKLLRQQIKGLL